MMAIHWQIAANFGAAWLAGGMIGLERSYHGRAAGFRTLSLVSLASAAVMMIALAPKLVPGMFPVDVDGLDPTRMAQGVMTGVGFLGAGVIFKEGVNVQGLTTAATVWATAALGLLFGLGEFLPGVLGTLAVLVTLIVMRWLEAWLPSQVYASSVFRFRADAAPTEAVLRALLASQGVSLSELSYARSHDGAIFEFQGNLRAAKSQALHDLAVHLRALDGLAEFQLQRISK